MDYAGLHLQGLKKDSTSKFSIKNKKATIILLLGKETNDPK